MTAKILALPNAHDPESAFDFDTASVSEKAAFRAGAQSVIDLLGPKLAEHGIRLQRRLRAVS
jgi:hypothetical protein